MKIAYKLKVILTIVCLSMIFVLILKSKTPNSIQTANSNISKYKILVDVEESRLYLIENGKLIKTYKCSGGKSTTPSPIGTWRITHKAKWGEGFRTEVF